MRVCANCQKEVADGDSFCGDCGAALAPVSSPLPGGVSALKVDQVRRDLAEMCAEWDKLQKSATYSKDGFGVRIYNVRTDDTRSELAAKFQSYYNELVKRGEEIHPAWRKVNAEVAQYRQARSILDHTFKAGA